MISTSKTVPECNPGAVLLDWQKAIDFKENFSVDRLVSAHLKKCVDAKLYK